MLVIDKTRFEALAEARFEDRLERLLIEHDTSARGQIDTPEGRAELRAQCANARRYGLYTEFDIARYVVTAWLMGVDFDRRFPAMTAILTDASLSPTQKADMIEQLTSSVLAELTLEQD